MADRTISTGTAGGSGTGETGGAGERARELKDQAQGKAARVAADARDRGEDLLEEGKEKARELGDQAAEVARSRGDEQRERVAQGVRTFAYALRRGADDLPEGRKEYGRYIDDVADRVESVSRYIEERDVESLTREARRFARDHTPLFLTGAFTLGMLGARFMKSSGDAAREERYDRGGSSREPWPEPFDRPEPYGLGRPSPGAEGVGYE
jgi:hypothetical protein